jgi:hypothetical protein
MKMYKDDMDNEEMDEVEFEATSPKVCWVDIKKADNGYIVSYSVKEKKLGAGKYDHVEHTEKKMLFNEKQEDEAFQLFVKMKKKELSNSERDMY